MSVFKKLQSVGTSKPYYGFTNLDIGYHRIICFRVVKNKFANNKDDECAGSGASSSAGSISKREEKTVIVELKDQVLFLPQYFLSQLSDREMNELGVNELKEKMYLYFGGRREKTK